MDDVSRREMMKATAAALAVPWLKVGGRAMAARVPAGGAPRFLSPAEYAALDELTELIIPTDDHSPGARAAGVAAYIDARLAESLEPEWRAKWRSGLQAVDALSRDLHCKAFLEGSADQRLAVVSRMAAKEATPGTEAERFFAEVKRWTVRGYYTSEIGIKVDQEYKGNIYQTGEYAGFDARSS